MEMKTKCCYTSAVLSLILLSTVTNGSTADQNGGCAGAGGKAVRKLFVFGDSYADTGNLPRVPHLVRSWYTPYGMTFPRKPTGRFSNGKLLTDFVASLMGIKSPIPHKYRKFGRTLLPYGMNFAFGGSGIFNTNFLPTNLTVQIDHFVGQVNAGVFSACDVASSMALVVISGNDYSYLQSTDPEYMKHIYPFMEKLFVQFKKDLDRLRELGLPKVVVTTLHPLGFTPFMTREYNYTRGPSDVMLAVLRHNEMLNETLHDLEASARRRRRSHTNNNDTTTTISSSNNSSKTFFALDVYSAFMNVIYQVNGATRFEQPLVPCCDGISAKNDCGDVDAEKGNLYTVCPDPDGHFYWDSVHPTQAGWTAVFQFLRPSLQAILLV